MTNEAFPSHRFDGAKEVPAITTNSSASSEAKDQVPDWAVGMAADVLESPFLRYGRNDPAKLEIARALLAAERRGIERAAKVVGQRVALASEVAPEAAAALFVALPDAIRQLGEEP